MKVKIGALLSIQQSGLYLNKLSIFLFVGVLPTKRQQAVMSSSNIDFYLRYNWNK